MAPGGLVRGSGSLSARRGGRATPPGVRLRDAVPPEPAPSDRGRRGRTVGAAGKVPRAAVAGSPPPEDSPAWRAGTRAAAALEGVVRGTHPSLSRVQEASGAARPQPGLSLLL